MGEVGAEGNVYSEGTIVLVYVVLRDEAGRGGSGLVPKVGVKDSC